MPNAKLKLKIFFLGTLFFSIFGLTKNALAGTAHYCDFSAASDGIGTYASPFKNISTVNAHVFDTGDDLYFKVGTSVTVAASGQLIIDWTGSVSDRAIIGAYYGDGLFGLDGGARPIFDGNFVAPGAGIGINALIQCRNQVGYVTIKDLQVQNSTGDGIEISQAYASVPDKTIYNTVENCYTKNTTGQGILLARASYSSIIDNIVERASYNRSPGASIEITGGNTPETSHYNTVSRNVVYWGFEGIGSYQTSKYTTIEDNIVYDCRSYHIYGTNSTHHVVRNNIVYETPNQLSGDAKDRLIAFDSENIKESLLNMTGNNEVYGNFLAGGQSCIALLSNANADGVYQSNNTVYDNIMVDCTNNIYIGQNDASCVNNSIYNNISYTTSGLYLHSNLYSPLGVTWGHNIFDDAVGGNAASEACTVPSPLAKTSGWDALAAGAVSAADFALSSTGIAERTACFGGDTVPPSTPQGLAVK